MPKPKSKVIVATICCANLVGCAAPQPEFVNPVKNTPTDWNTVLPTVELQDATRYPWWQALGSAELNTLVNQALQQNTSIERAENATRLANAQLKTVELGWLPSLNIFGGRITGNTTLFFQGLPVPVSNVGSFLGVLPNYFINLFQLPYQQRQAMERVNVARAEMLAVRLAMVGEVVSAYAVAVGANEEIKQLRHLKSRLARQQQLLSDLTAVGLASQVMVNEIAAQAAGIDGQMALVQANATAATNALNTLVKNNLNWQPTLRPGQALSVSDSVAQQTPVAILNTRPDIVADRARVLAATTGIDVQTMLLAPTLDFNALRTNISVQVNDLGASNDANFTAGYAALTLDPQIFGLIDISELRARDALLQYVQSVDRALRQSEDALARLQSAQQNLAALKRQRQVLTQNVKNLRALQQAQLASELSVLEADIQATLSQMGVIQAQTQTLLAYVNQQQAMGIGVLFDIENIRLVDGQIEMQANEEIR